ncbi:unnamed protein product [Boreogadus saida]
MSHVDKALPLSETTVLSNDKPAKSPTFASAFRDNDASLRKLSVNFVIVFDKGPVLPVLESEIDWLTLGSVASAATPVRALRRGGTQCVDEGLNGPVSQPTAPQRRLVAGPFLP